MDLQLQGTNVLVTGASGGIGAAVARLFLAQGANVVAHYNTNRPEHHPCVQADLSDEGQVAAIFAAHKIQVLIVNHGVWPETDVPLKDMSLQQWKSTMDTNLTSSFLVVREYLKNLEFQSPEEKAKASIVIIGSTAGKFGEAGHADYAASKSALMYGFTMTMKNEIVKTAPKGRVNCVAPGWVKTPMAENALKDPQVVYRALATTPLRKVAVPHDIATQVVLLSSNAVSGHVSGQVLMVEGGMEGRLLNYPEDINLSL
ncbi:hypothetical protein AX16_007301 [Volvariella volvacea WC 439]|nr:hypothetical protein AX16_007301 [Volvariella volvacea WC 439]